MRPGIVVALCLALGAAACGGESKVPVLVESPRITVAPSSVTLPAGGADSLTYLVTGVAAAGDPTADWSASDTTVVRLSPLPAHQVFVLGRKAGSASVIASWRTDPRIQAAAIVTVR